VEKPVTPQRIRVGGNVQAANLIRRVTPQYPPLAKQARVQGTVRFTAIIGKDGTIQNLTLVSGHPLLVQAAQDAEAVGLRPHASESGTGGSGHRDRCEFYFK
jgi:protein TonB